MTTTAWTTGPNGGMSNTFDMNGPNLQTTSFGPKHNVQFSVDMSSGGLPTINYNVSSALYAGGQPGFPSGPMYGAYGCYYPVGPQGSGFNRAPGQLGQFGWHKPMGSVAGGAQAAGMLAGQFGVMDEPWFVPSIMNYYLGGQNMQMQQLSWQTQQVQAQRMAEERQKDLDAQKAEADGTTAEDSDVLASALAGASAPTTV